jgi:hypothetical protein
VQRQKLIEFIVAHRVWFRFLRVSLIPALDVGDNFPDRPIFQNPNINFELCSDLDYFGASEASVVVVEPVSGASAGSVFPGASPSPPTGSSGTPNITARTTS